MALGEWGRPTEEGEAGVAPVQEHPVVVPVHRQMFRKLGRELERDEQLERSANPVRPPPRAPHPKAGPAAQRRCLVGAIHGYVVMCPDFSDGRALCLGVGCMGRVMWDGACSRTLLRRENGVLALAEACSRRRKAA